MKAGLLILPFLALLIGAVGTAIGSSIPEAKWIAQVAWALGAGIVALWAFLDRENFKAAFARKGAKYGASSGIVVLLGVLIIVGAASIAARPRFNKSYDVTRDKLNTLSDQSFKLIDQLKGQVKAGGKPVSITAYVNEDQTQTLLKDLVAMYQAAGANFAVEYVDPNKNPTRALADKVNETNTIIIKRGEQEKRITAFNEEKFTNALVNVMKEKTKKIYFTKGHGEGALKGTEPNGFSAVVTELESNKNHVEELSLIEAAKIPDDADMLVIGGPKYDFKEEEARVVEDYLKRGGSVLTMVDAINKVDTLNHLLEKFGVRYNNDLLILDPEVASSPYGQNVVIVSEFDEFSPVTKDFAKQSQTAMMMSFTRSVTEVTDNANKLKVTLAGKTNKATMLVKNVVSKSDLENLGEDRIEKGSFPVIAVASGKPLAPATAKNDKKDDDTKSDAPKPNEAAQGKETRLIVVGSVTFADNNGAQAGQHRDMFMNMTNYLLQDDDFISIRPKDPTKSTIDLTTPQSQLVLLLLAFVYPFFFLGSGTLAWLRRRRA